MKPTNRIIRFTINIDEELNEALEEEAYKIGLPKCSLIYSFLKQSKFFKDYLKRKDKVQK